MVRPGMLLGIGTGSTARHFIAGLAGRDVVAVATSRASADQARALGVAVTDQPDRPLDLAVDGADEVDPALSLVKGRGGALFREKLVALAARRFIVIADESKLVDRLAVGVVPVEVLGFLWRSTARRLEGLGCSWVLRGGEEAPFVTDNGNLVLDLTFPGGVRNPSALAHALKETTGVCEHGLFVNLATAVILAGPTSTRVLGDLDAKR